MNHQFFENLLLSDSELTQVELTMLQEHLQTCEACRQFSNALEDVDHLFHNTPIASPAVGFTQRWQESVIQDNKKRQKRQIWLILIVGVCSISALFALLGFTILPVLISPIAVLWAELFNLVTWFSAVEWIVGVLLTMFRAAHSVVPTSLWIALSFAFMGLCAVWVVAFKQVTAPRRLVI
ncbi:MAG: zf-HC2 domain-containing protein [Anaerolineales bacterium]|nr:zf-HC2 domain-containing protein [Anaerolineales bacterium]